MTDSHERCLTSLRELLWELATELDLHYEDEDLHALSKTVNRMKIAIKVLEEAKISVPEEVTHILQRFHRSLQ